MKLISMTDFVLHQYSNNYHANTPTRILNYARFLKQPLKLEMFVPCDEDGNVLNEPKDWKTYESGGSAFMNIDEILPCQDYKKAKEKVLFEGFEAKNYLNLVGLKHKTWDSWYMGCYKTVEDLSGCKNIFITESALKQIQP